MSNEVKYYEATVSVKGTTLLGVFAKSETEALKLLDEYVRDIGIDEFSTDFELDDCEVDFSSIMECDIRAAYEVVNSEEDFQEEYNV